MSAKCSIMKKYYHIKWAIHEFAWERSLANNEFSKKVLLFTKTIINILSNCIPHETIFVTIEILGR